jgi:hypothetical protein
MPSIRQPLIYHSIFPSLISLFAGGRGGRGAAAGGAGRGRGRST